MDSTHQESDNPLADDALDVAEALPVQAEAYEQIKRLQAELDEKEQLIAALTEHLELAAEQLDRMRRTGCVPGAAIPTAYPPELIDNHKELVDQLKQIVDQWQDMQAESLPVDSEAYLQVRGLQTELEEKEHLISALTHRLEQAAEQIDRLRRSGGHGGDFAGGGGSHLPTELVDDHKELVGQLKLVVDQWQDMQAEAAIGRLEAQLSELRDLVAGKVIGAANPHVHPASGSHGPSGTVAPSTAPPATHASPGSASAHASSATHAPAPTGSKSTSLAEVLSKFGYHPELEEGEQEGAPSHPAPVSTPPPRAEAASSASGFTAPDPETAHSEPSRFADDAPLPDRPPPIDVAAADAEQLRDALIERDRCIDELLQRIEAFQSIEVPSPDIPGLAELPEAQRAFIKDWESRLQKQLRNAEVELSLERARLTREQNLLRQQIDQANKDRKQRRPSALLKPDAEEDDKDQAARGGAAGRNWLGFMRGKQDE